MAIVTHASNALKLFSGKIEIDESYFGGRKMGLRGRGATN